jgi:hypothetical protein
MNGENAWERNESITEEKVVIPGGPMDKVPVSDLCISIRWGT